MFSGLLSSAASWLGAGNNSNYLDNRYTTTALVGTTTPVWIDTTNKWVLYQQVPELQAVIRRYSSMVASARPVVKDLEGNILTRKDKPSHWVFDLIDRPNAMQAWSKMVYMTAINQCVTGNALIFTPKGLMGNVQNMTPLAFNNVQIVPTGVSLRQTAIDGFIEKFKVPTSAAGSFEYFEAKEVVYLCEADGINLFDAKSKLDGLKMPISNIVSGYKKRNVLLENLFSLGVLTGRAASDGMSVVPIEPEDVKDMRDDLKARHGGEVIVTDKDFKFEPMSFPVKELMLFEEMTADKLELIDAYGLNQNMFSLPTAPKGGTFSNVEMGEKQAYNSTIIPDTVSMYDEINVQTGLKKEGLLISPSFEHISVLKEDETQAADALLSRSQALEKINEQIALSDDDKRLILRLGE